MSTEKRVTAEVLEAFVRAALLALGLPEADARLGAEYMVWANLRGVDSHGVNRLPWVVWMATEGHLNPRPQMRILRETPATALLDGDRGLGPVTATYAMSLATEKARISGLGWTLLANTTSPLAVGFYAEQAAAAGQIGIAVTYGGRNMAPYGARENGLHNGPLAIAAPGGRVDSPLLDMATSVVAQGKLEVAQARGEAIPEGWALDAEGRPSTDPGRYSMLLPFGTYKGSGLSFMLACLTEILAGTPQLGPALAGRGPAPGLWQTAILAALDVKSFTDLTQFQAGVDELVEGVRGLAPAEGFEEVLVPGDPEAQTRSKRREMGIPLPPGTVRALEEVAQKLGLEGLV